MKLLKNSTLFLLFGLLSIGLAAQDQQQTQSIDEGSISDQFDFVIRKSNNWKDPKGQAYEVIRRNVVLTLKAHVEDSLKTIQATLNSANGTVKSLELEIKRLTAELTQVQANLDATQKEKDRMTFIGKQLSKSTYQLITWTIIGGLLVLLFIFIFKYKGSRQLTMAVKKRLSEVENEFSEHKRITLEREQKIKRQLQDEINRRLS